MKHFLYTVTAITALLLGFPVGASAQAIPQPIPPTFQVQRPDMTPMRFLMGTWMCSMPGSSTTLTFSSTMDGMWMLGHGESSASSQSGKATAYLYMTFDRSQRMWVLMTLNSIGGYGLNYSVGWQGDTMQFKDATGRGDADSMTMTKISDTELRITQNQPDQTGYQRQETYTCHKSG